MSSVSLLKKRKLPSSDKECATIQLRDENYGDCPSIQTKKNKTTEFIKSSFRTYLNTSLFEASKLGYEKSIDILLEQKADIHIDDDKALRNASYGGHYKVVKILLKHKANVRAGGNSALRYASIHGHTKMVKILLEHKADIHSQDDYSLRTASFNNRSEIVKILLEHKANVNAKYGEPLQNACQIGNTQIVKSLLEHNADFQHRQYSLTYLLYNGYSEIVQLLILYGDNHQDIFDKNIAMEHIRPRKLMELFVLYQRLCHYEQTTKTDLFHRRDILQSILQF